MIATVRICLLLTVMIAFAGVGTSQPVTGVWRGRVTKGNGLLRQTYKLEVKLVKNGDSITGTSYYYASTNNYYRYSVKGYFGAHDNSVNWWDDQLIESRSPNVKLGNANNRPLLSVADYNCPGSGVMLLDGHTQPTGGEDSYDLHLQKMQHPDFPDEWDPIIETYFDGGADPYLIDSVGQIAFLKKAVPVKPVVTPTSPEETTVYQPSAKEPVPVKRPVGEIEKQPVTVNGEEPELVQNPWKNDEAKHPDTATAQSEKSAVKPVPAKEVKTTAPVSPPVVVSTPVVKTAPEVKPIIETKPVPLTVEEKFTRRKTVLNTTIPVSGDTVEFRFYDNAEVDGDSISIFLNGRMLYTHIRLTDKGYSVKIPVAALQAGDNELVMVAENLGSIPPNTAYMEAWSGNRRYTARMESTELSSAMIRLKKE